MGTDKTRQFKFSWLMQRINLEAETSKMISEEYLISEFCLFFASSKRTCNELLDILRVNKKIIIEFGEIYPKGVLDVIKLREKEDLEADKVLENL